MDYPSKLIEEAVAQTAWHWKKDSLAPGITSYQREGTKYARSNGCSEKSSPQY
jgi:hypothetical protein